MVKVFIANIDTSFGHNLANVLSNTFVGSRGGGAAEGGEEEPEEEAQGQAQGQGNEQKEKTKEKEKYVVSGSFLPEAQPLQHPAKAGKMVETGDKKKDAARREAIEKIPTRGVKPKGASECIPAGDKEKLLKGMLDADIIVYDTLTNLDEATWAVDTLAEMVDFFEKPKTFIALSTIMTWAKTKVENEDPETAIPEDEYRRRKPHPNFKGFAALEKTIVKHSKKEKFKGFVIAPGLVYHSGDSIFHSLFKAAWHNEQFLTCYGDGTNVLPCIHLDDLLSITVEVIETAPEAKYIVAVDDSKNTLFDIIKAIADNLSNGLVKKITKEDAFLNSALTQQDYDMLTVNLRLEPGWTKEAGIEMKYDAGIIENIGQLVQDYKDSRGLWSLKVFVHGPPAAGKSLFAQKIAAHYKIHYLEADAVVQETIANYERRVNGGQYEGEEVDVDGERQTMIELKEAIKANNGKLPSAQLIDVIRSKLRSMPCKNQGYVIDGYPTTVEEASELFKPSDDDGGDETKKADFAICPEFIFTLDATDISIKQRIMKLPEAQVAGTRNSEESLTKRLEEYRKVNTDELTVLNYFDELEITPIVLHVETSDSNQVFGQICHDIGEPRNYGKSPEQLLEESKEAESKRILAESIANEERVKREREENERHEKVTAEWQYKLEQVRKQERETLEVQSEPLRNYLVKYVMPTLTAGLIEVSKVRPEDPIDYLAEFLFKVNYTERRLTVGIAKSRK